MIYEVIGVVVWFIIIALIITGDFEYGKENN